MTNRYIIRGDTVKLINNVGIDSPCITGWMMFLVTDVSRLVIWDVERTKLLLIEKECNTEISNFKDIDSNFSIQHSYVINGKCIMKNFNSDDSDDSLGKFTFM